MGVSRSTAPDHGPEGKGEVIFWDCVAIVLLVLGNLVNQNVQLSELVHWLIGILEASIVLRLSVSPTVHQYLLPLIYALAKLIFDLVRQYRHFDDPPESDGNSGLDRDHPAEPKDEGVDNTQEEAETPALPVLPEAISGPPKVRKIRVRKTPVKSDQGDKVTVGHHNNELPKT